jgi:hypothetical protein
VERRGRSDACARPIGRPADERPVVLRVPVRERVRRERQISLWTICGRAVRAGTDDRNGRRKQARVGRRGGLFLLVRCGRASTQLRDARSSKEERRYVSYPRLRRCSVSSEGAAGRGSDRPPETAGFVEEQRSPPELPLFVPGERADSAGALSLRHGCGVVLVRRGVVASSTACVSDASAGAPDWPCPALFWLTAENASRESAVASSEALDPTRARDSAHVWERAFPDPSAGLWPGCWQRRDCGM